MRNRLLAKVNGKIPTTICNQSGKLYNGKNVPQKKVIGVIIKFITEDNASGFLIQRPMAIPKIPKQKADNKIPKNPQRLNIGTLKNTIAMI